MGRRGGGQGKVEAGSWPPEPWGLREAGWGATLPVTSIPETDIASLPGGRMPRALKNPNDLIPLTPRVFHILLALVDGEQHGYRIMKEVEDRSGGRVRIGPGTLYEAIHRLVGTGLIEESGDRPDAEMDDQRRRYYRLTDLGSQVLRAESQRLAELVGFARTKKLVRKTRTV